MAIHFCGAYIINGKGDLFFSEPSSDELFKNKILNKYRSVEFTTPIQMRKEKNVG